MEIRLLNEETISKIAAGEVIERPLNVVKELVENSIDAGSTAITVEIRDGGISMLRVTDNGCGIEKDQIKKAFLRHATSKIKNADDLSNLSSLGFRGEALASIASVGQVEMITKVRGQLSGVRAVNDHLAAYSPDSPVRIDLEEIGAPDGTTVIVRNLFGSIPVRRRFLRQPQTEAGYITDLIEKQALSHPRISFHYRVNGQDKLHTTGSGDLKELIYRIYGRETAAAILPVHSEDTETGMKLDGFIGRPEISRSTRNFETFFINGRMLRSRELSVGLEEGYRTDLMQHRFPFAVLHLTIAPSEVDVNVHPSKMEVRFSDRAAVIRFLDTSVHAVLHGTELIPRATMDTAAQERARAKKEKAAKKELLKKEASLEAFETGRAPSQPSPQPEPEQRDQAAGPVTGQEVSGQKVSSPQQGSGQEVTGREVSSPQPGSGLEVTGQKVSSPQQGSGQEAAWPRMDSGEEVPSPRNLSDKFRTPVRPAAGKSEGCVAEGYVSEASVAEGYVSEGFASQDFVFEDRRPYEKTKNENTKNDKIIKDENIKSENLKNESAGGTDLLTASVNRLEQMTLDSLFPADSKEGEQMADRLLTEEKSGQFRYIGQVFETYWLIEYRRQLLIIDQHAAHEKVNYERIMKRIEREYPSLDSMDTVREALPEAYLSKDRFMPQEQDRDNSGASQETGAGHDPVQHSGREPVYVSSQQLLPPIVIRFSGREESAYLQFQNVFAAMGYEIEEFGQGTYTIRAVPTELFGQSADTLLREILEEIMNERVSGTPRAVISKVASMSCKAAVKGNRRLSETEARALIKELLTLDNPYHCPHGRPTMIVMNQREMDRKFKRII